MKSPFNFVKRALAITALFFQISPLQGCIVHPAYTPLPYYVQHIQLGQFLGFWVKNWVVWVVTGPCFLADRMVFSKHPSTYRIQYRGGEIQEAPNPAADPHSFNPKMLRKAKEIAAVIV